MTGIAFRAGASTNADTAATSLAVTKPAGTASGDVLIGVVGIIVAGTITPPSGWTSIELDAVDSNIRMQGWYKVAGGSEPSSYTWSFGASKGFAWIGAYQNVDNTTPVDVDTDANTSSAGTVTVSATPVTAAAWLVTTAIGRHSTTTARTIGTSDGSDGSRYSHGNASGSGFDYAAAVFDSNRDLTTGAASRTLTTSAGTENGIAALAIALRPATPPTLKARVTQASLSAPPIGALKRARVLQASLSAPASGGGKKARVLQASLSAPLAAGSPPKTGAYVSIGGNIRRVAVKVCKDGVI